MKFIQLLGNIEGFGVTRYIIELKAALEMINHEVEVIYFNNNLKSTNNTQSIENLIFKNCFNSRSNEVNKWYILLLSSMEYILKSLLKDSLI